MTSWGDLEVGSRVLWDGSEHIVKALKRGGLNVRVVLEPDIEGKVAKVAVRARLGDEVEIPEGAELPDRAGTAITTILGGKEVAHKGEDDDIFTCPPVDTTTVASHLRILHGIELQGLEFASEEDLMRVHGELHEAPFHEPPYPHEHQSPEEATT